MRHEKGCWESLENILLTFIIFIHFNHFCWNIMFLTRFNNTEIFNYFFYFSKTFFLKKITTKSKFLFFTLIKLGCWSNNFVAIDNRILIAFKSPALLFVKLDILKLEMISEKYLLKIQQNSALSETFLPSSVRLIFLLFEFFIWFFSSS